MWRWRWPALELTQEDIHAADNGNDTFDLGSDH